MWEFNNDKPVYIQIMDEIKSKIISGEYTAGQRIPSVRELAEEARVNPNTMQKALMEAEREGYIVSMRTIGKYITNDVNKIAELKLYTAQNEGINFVRKMKKLGLSYDEVQTTIKKLYDEYTE